jgi:hypothetical protein
LSASDDLEEHRLKDQRNEKVNNQSDARIPVKQKTYVADLDDDCDSERDKGWKHVANGRTPKGICQRELNAANPTTEQEYKQRSNRYRYDEECPEWSGQSRWTER